MDIEKEETFETKLSEKARFLDGRGRVYRMASTVVLPRNRRISTQSLAGDSMKLKTPSISVKSLPHLKKQETVKPKLMRSISDQHEPRLHGTSPFPARRVLFAPITLPIEEAEEEVDSSSSSCTSTTESLSEDKEEDPGAQTAKEKRNLLNSAVSKHASKFPDASKMGFLQVQDKNSMMKSFPSSSHLTKESMESPEDSEPLKMMRYVSSPEEDEGFTKEQEEYFEQYREDDEDEDAISYNDFYNCMPPPIFMLFITITEIGCFIYHAKRLKEEYGYISKFSPAPLDSVLIYDPTRRYEVWRYLSYALVHSGYMHLINNIVVQLVLGILLEMVHKWWRVLAIYFAGILAGSLATSISEPFNFLAGASAGVYALITAHVSTVILNWTEMEHPWVRVLVFLAFVIHDGGTAVYFGYVLGEKTNVGYAAHLGGAVAGLLVGIHVLKNLQWKKWEEILWWFCIVVCVLLLLFAIAWNVFRPELFP